MPDGPLENMRIAVTRAEAECREIAGEILALGGIPIVFPCIEFGVPEDLALVKHSLASLESYDYILFSSPTAVRMFNLMLEKHGGRSTIISRPNIIALGRKTAEYARKAGYNVWFAARGGSAAGLLEELKKKEWELGFSNRRILLPRSSAALKALSTGLDEMGLLVDDVVFYRTAVPERPDRNGLRELTSGGADFIVFFSPSAVTGFSKLLPVSLLVEIKTKSRAAAIGNTTCAAARDAGFDVVVEAREHSSRGLLDALIEYARSGH